jgi:hypothetical protein
MQLIVHQPIPAFLFAWSFVRLIMYISFPGPRNVHADRTLAFVLVYPFVAWVASQKPLGPALGIPLALLGVAFMFAGQHLRTALKNPGKITPHTYVGLPYSVWIGMLVSGALIGVLLQFARR